MLREVAAEFERPAVLFSGMKRFHLHPAFGRESVPAFEIPMPFLNVETGHEFRS